MDKMMNDIDWDLLARYLSGECSGEEEKRAASWLESDAANRRSLDLMRRIWDTPDVPSGESDANALWRELAERAGIVCTTGRLEPAKIRRFIPRLAVPECLRRPAAVRYLRVAAVLLAILSIPYFYLKFTGPRGMEEVLVANGEREELTLPDGTAVTLDSGSLFRYPGKFAEERREVFLDGEGYFAVRPDQEKPFLVHADGAEVRVLGTEFNVRAWPMEKRVEVVVAEGSVSFSPVSAIPTDGGVTISGGQMSVLGGNGMPSPPRDVDVEKYLGWVKRELYFESVPLRQVLDQLERWYDLSIRVGDPEIESDLITVYIENKPIEDNLETIALIMNMEFEITGNDVIFEPR